MVRLFLGVMILLQEPNRRSHVKLVEHIQEEGVYRQEVTQEVETRAQPVFGVKGHRTTTAGVYHHGDVTILQS